MSTINFVYEGESHNLEVRPDESVGELTADLINTFTSMPQGKLLGFKCEKRVFPPNLVLSNPKDFSEGSYTVCIRKSEEEPAETQEPETRVEESQFSSITFALSEGVTFELNPNDTRTLETVSSALGLSDVTIRDFIENFQQFMKSNGLFPALRFEDLCVYFQEPTSESVLSLFHELFELLGDETMDDKAKPSSLLAALSFLTLGKKSDKLLALFGLFQDGKGQRLPELKMFLFSILSFILSISGATGDISKDTVLSACEKYAKMIFESSNTDLDGTITFEQFGSWYNTGGFDMISWMELLCQDKWPRSPVEEYDDTQEHIFDFNLQVDNSKLIVTPNDLEDFLTLLEDTELDSKSLDFLKGEVEKLATSNGFIRPADYDELLEVLGVTSQWKRVFDLIGHCLLTEGGIPAIELIVALSVFVEGRKSDKLSHCFYLMSGQEDTLEKNEFIVYLSSFLTTLMCLSSTTIETVDAGYISTFAMKSATAFANKIMGSKDKISYTEFGDWYNEGGNEIMAWIELLDAHKWTCYEYNDEMEEEEELEEPPYFFFLLTPSGDRLSITVDDLKTMEAVELNTKLDQKSPEWIHDIFKQNSDSNGMISDAAFNKCVQTMIPRERLTVGAQETLTNIFTSIFAIYKNRPSDKVKSHIISSAMSLFASGTKSQKLSSAFKQFQKTKQNVLTYDEMHEFITTFVLVLLVFVRKIDVTSADEVASVKEIAADASKMIVSQLFDACGGEDMSFDDFAKWYTSVGHESMSWIELLAVSKWPRAGSQQVFQISITPTLELNIYTSGVKMMESAHAQSGLGSITMKELISKIAPYTSEETITAANLRAFLIDISNHTITEKARRSLDRMYSFYGNGDSAPKASIIAGLSILASGSKSEKLIATFGLFDKQNRGNLSRTELSEYLGSFLRVLFAFRQDADPTDAQKVCDSIDDAVEEVTETILSEAICKSPQGITYQEFGEWYNRTGFNSLQWIELLDNTKWSRTIDDMAEEEELYEDDPEQTPACFAEAEKEAEELGLTRKEVNDIMRILSMTKFASAKCTPQSVIEDIEQYNAGGFISVDNYSALICSYLPQTGADEAMELLTRLFQCLSLPKDNKCEINRVKLAWLCLAQGSQYEKLDAAWALVCDKGDTEIGKYTERHLFKLARAMLAVSMAYRFHEACAHSLYDLDNDATGFVRSIKDYDEMSSIPLSVEQLVDFSVMTPGYFTILEVFCNPSEQPSHVSQPPAPVAAVEYSMEAVVPRSDHMLIPLPQRQAPPPPEEPKMTIKLTESGDRFSVSGSDMDRLRMLRLSGALERPTPRRVVELVSEVMDAEEKVSPENFFNVVQQMLPPGSVADSSREMILENFRNLFPAFANGNPKADARTVCCSLILLSAGTRESKLHYSFKLFANNDEVNDTSEVDKYKLASFIKTLLTTLFTLNQCEVAQRTGDADAIVPLIDSATVETVFSIYEDAEKDLAEEDLISYDDFKTWLTEKRGLLAQWITLL